MRNETLIWTAKKGWVQEGNAGTDAQLILFFSSLQNGLKLRISELHSRFPNAEIVGCSGVAEINGEELTEYSLTAVAVYFESTQIRVARVPHTLAQDSEANGIALARKLASDDLRAALVLGPGFNLNATRMIQGMSEILGPRVPISGGLAGDPPPTTSCWTYCHGSLSMQQIVCVGFYGDDIRVSHGCFGGWDAFGPQRIITKASGNVLYELDGRPALELYRRYLGPEADNLPMSAQYFPMLIRSRVGDTNGTGVIRTVLSINDIDDSMISAGELTEGYSAQFMRGNLESLIDGAGHAAASAAGQLPHYANPLAIMVSCYGRKLVLGQRCVEEIESVCGQLPQKTTTVGFYSFGEISPTGCDTDQMHNQTMTLTLISEAPHA